MVARHVVFFETAGEPGPDRVKDFSIYLSAANGRLGPFTEAAPLDELAARFARPSR
ncbi:hypothetical protein ABCS02_11750 [Microbacterium sp. X-17]|uniref:hypothetical protein n=1 Tax=Microbacterium sp. X-17 TaxID=3144404 RepID=UPI0031F5D033